MSIEWMQNAVKIIITGIAWEDWSGCYTTDSVYILNFQCYENI